MAGMLLVFYISFFLAEAFGAKASSLRTLASQRNVSLDYATFVGFENETTGITSFLGIPFADPPIGDLRWQAPVFPPSQNLGIVDATQFRDACISTMQNTVDPGTSEDCLFGNVFIPSGATSNSSLPVMVWFHGGGFETGSSHDADPRLMMKSSSLPMIFVSFDYRLGQFGFLAGSTIGANGTLNAGLHDQRAGLRWVNRYISEFGGDPSRVTIWGESAGAGSTMFHLLVNGGDTEGLFHKAMGDSPSLNFMPFFSDDYLERIFEQFATFVGCDLTNISTVLPCLRSADSDTLTLAGSQVIANRSSTLYVFAPILDGTFLPNRPVEAFTNGSFAQVPVLFGSNTDEGAHWSATLPNPAANTSEPNATETTVFNFLQGQYANFTRASFNRSLELYPLSDYNNSFSLQGQQMYGEMRYICTAVLISGGAAQVGLTSFQYHYDDPHLMSFHGNDLEAFFPANVPAVPPDENDETLFEAMREFWTSFVTSGTPTSKASVWDAAAKFTNDTNGSPRILLHPGGIQMENITDALAERCAFWHSLRDELNT